MGITSNLYLTTVSITEGSAVLFQTFRDNLAGTSSNMTKIDTWAGGVNGSIVALQNNKPVIYVSGSYTSPNYYVASGVTSFPTSYVVGTIIDLVLDATTTGTVTLNINGLGTKTVQKVDSSSGSLINLTNGDLKKNKENIFRYSSSGVWVWVNATSADQIPIVGNNGNLVSISGSGLIDSGISTSGCKISSSALYTGSGITVASGSIVAVTGSPIGVSSSGSIVHLSSGVLAGSYVNVIVNSYGHVTAGSTISQLTELTSPTSDDLFLMMDDPSGSGINKKMTIQSLLDVFNSGWIPDNHTWTYVSGSVFKISGYDLTNKLEIGTKYKIKQSGSYLYFYSGSPVYTAGSTVVSVYGGTDYALVNATITECYYSQAESPEGFPDKFTYVPTVTGFTSNPTPAFGFSLKGKICSVIPHDVTGTSNATTITFTLPIPCSYTTRSSGMICNVVDNGVAQTTPGVGHISNANIVTVYKAFYNSAFTTSGTKTMVAPIFAYLVAG